MGVFDWMFGEKLEMEFPDGKKVLVSKRWFYEMQRQGKLGVLTDTHIQVHMIGRPPEFELYDEDAHSEWVASGCKTYKLTQWRIDIDVTAEQARTNRDPKTGDLYVVYLIEGGEWKGRFATRKMFEKIKRMEDRR